METTNRNGALAKQAKAKIFSKAAGCEFEAVVSKSGYDTVKIQAAPKVLENVIWKDSITVYPDKSELISLINLFCCQGINRVEIKRQNKGITLERQSGHVYLCATNTQRRVNLPIPPGDTVIIGALMIAQLKKQCFGVENGMLMLLIKGACKL